MAAAHESRRERCRALVGPKTGDDLPFDLKRAHALYQGLLGPFSKLIADKHLLIVPDGPLAALPLQVLLTAPPDEGTATPAERYQKAAWLAAKHSVTVLPSVASLKALRTVAGRSPAAKAYAAFANPLLTGADGSDRSAWAAVGCNPARRLVVAANTDRLPRGTLRSYLPRGNRRCRAAEEAATAAGDRRRGVRRGRKPGRRR